MVTQAHPKEVGRQVQITVAQAIYFWEFIIFDVPGLQPYNFF